MGGVEQERQADRDSEKDTETDTDRQTDRQRAREREAEVCVGVVVVSQLVGALCPVNQERGN